jgi:hypothetical protein
VFVEDGRSFVERTRTRYDLITASLVDTWAASSAGAYALAENSLYTVEAFRSYLHALKPDGIVSFSRWYTNPPIEVFRVVALARQALRDIGVTRPEHHVAIVRTDSRLTGRPSLATILMKRSPFTEAELRRLSAWSAETQFDLAYLPPLASTRGSEPAFATLLGTDAEVARFFATARADLTPTTDDRPFFFDRVPLMAWLGRRLGLPGPAYADEDLPLASQILLMTFAATAAGTLLLLLLPLSGRQPASTERADPETLIRTRLAWIAYFGCLGLGYIVVEIALIQRFNLYLGNPAYALAVVLFTMLLASGTGGFVADRWRERRAILPMMLTVCLALAGTLAILSRLISGTMAAPIPIRIALAVLTVAPVGFVMGMPFPTGLRQAGRISPSLVSWAWAVNGATSVTGSVLAVIVSMGVGLTASYLAGLSAYVVALGIAAGLVRSDPIVAPAVLPAPEIIPSSAD